MSPICSKCGSENIIPGARVAGSETTDALAWTKFELHAFVDESPDALLFRKTRRARIYARICGDCGFTELYSRNHRDLFAAYQKSKPNDE